MRRSVFFVAYGSCTFPCSLPLNISRSLLISFLVRSVSTSETKSSASFSSSSFILPEGELFNKSIFVGVDSRLKYWAICCSINQSVLNSISGRCRLLNSLFEKPHLMRLTSYQFSPLFKTHLRKKSNCFLCFLKGPSKVHLANKGFFVKIFA